MSRLLSSLSLSQAWLPGQWLVLKEKEPGRRSLSLTGPGFGHGLPPTEFSGSNRLPVKEKEAVPAGWTGQRP